MKPKILILSGLNSFEEEQKIYFDKLTEKGLFGIFGPTGSGKSTILDAITIALYGKVTRTNKGYINTETKNLTVSYEFEIGVGRERKTYVAERNIKVNKSGGYNTKYARLLEKRETEVVVIAEGPSELQLNIEKIIGLTAEDFTRSVVLPQGKFSEFLKLTGKDKRDMLERMFALERYGRELGEKIKRVRNQHLKQENMLTGELKKYEGLTEESFKEKEVRLDELIKEEALVKEEKRILDEAYEKYKEVWELQGELNEFKISEKNLNAKVEEIYSKKERLQKAQKALKVKPFIDDLLETKSLVKNNEIELKDLLEEVESIDKKLCDTEKNYNEAMNQKEEVIPELIKKEANLNQAIVIYEKVKELNIDIKKLRDEYQKKSSSKNTFDKMIKDLDIRKEELGKNILEIEKRLNKISFQPEYREKVQVALEKENQFNETLEKKNELGAKKSIREASLNKVLEDYKEIIEIQEKQKAVVTALENEIKTLENSNPGDNSILLEKSERVNELREKLNKAILDNEKKVGLEKKLIELEKNKLPVVKGLEELKGKLSEKKSNLQNIIEEINHIHKASLAGILSSELEKGEPCPVCGSENHPNPAKFIDKKELEERENLRKELEIETEKINIAINELSFKLVGFTKEEEHLRGDYNLVLESLEGIDVPSIKTIKEQEEKDFKELKEKLEIYNKYKERNSNNLNIEKDKKSKIDMKEAKVNESIKSERAIVEELNKELLKEIEKHDRLLKEYESYKKELKVDSIANEMNSIKEREKEILNLQKSEKEVRCSIEKINNEKEKLISERAELEIDLGRISQSGKEKADVIKREEEEVNKLSEGKNPEEYLEVVRNEIKVINDKSERLKVQLEDEKNKRQQLWNKKLSLEEASRILSARYKEQDIKLSNVLEGNQFKEKEEVLSLLMDERAMTSIEEEINSFNDKLKNITNNISRIEKKLQGEVIEETQWENLKNNRIDKDKLLSLKIKEIATLQKTISDLKNDIEELTKLRKKQKELEHKLSLLSDLSKLVEGNKFVEFVAMNQLKYIAREASRRLKDITKERYALEIDGEGNFTIRDDFNGGQIRDTNTLSGGETFLTSLALALALSTQVQLKGSAPLEFFFLDEGFGTLDTDLLDIVMTSLEKLHSDKLCVGIISHVEELKSRVPVKIVLSPAKQGQGGSKVKLEYS